MTTATAISGDSATSTQIERLIQAAREHQPAHAWPGSLSDSQEASLADSAEARDAARRLAWEDQEAARQADYLLAQERRAECEGRLANQDLADRLARQQHAARLAEMQAAARERCTVAGLLAHEPSRRDLWAALGQAKKYIESPIATRAVVIEALAILRERQVRRSARGVAESARRGKPGRIASQLAGRRRAAAAAAAKRFRDRIAAGKLGAAATRKLVAAHRLAEFGLGSSTSPVSDGLVRCLVNAVGRIGEQCRADLAALDNHYDFQGKKSRHHKLEGSEVASVQVGAGWRAVLVTMRDFCSFGSRNWGSGDRSYGSRGGSSYRCYLIVRDSTSGEAHCLRVPPKFGNSETKFYGTFASDSARVAAAVAWTFGLEGREYRPDVTA
ncbi:MAG: hypothetical protein ABSG68_26895 [Thermoguttaceae bacterium]|jgi:hypothetical protein